MKIDYAAIIAQANARKDALLQFEAAAKQLHCEMSWARETLLPAAAEFERAYQALDAEARLLLPGASKDNGDPGHTTYYYMSCLRLQLQAFHKVGGVGKLPPDVALNLLIAE